MKLNWTKILLLAVILFLPIFALQAADEENKRTVFVASDETITGNLLAASERVVVDGTISGDLIVAATYITVTGRVEGDIIAIGQDINIEGEVGGNIRVIASSVYINSLVSRNLNVLASTFIIGKDSRIGWDVISAAVDTTVRGNIIGSLSSYSQNIFISGKIGKNANLKLYSSKEGALIVDNNATINGDFNYSANNELILENASAISGEVTFNKIDEQTRTPISSWLWSRLFSLLSLLFIGSIFVFFLSSASQSVIQRATSKTGYSILIGAAAFLIIPPLVIISALTIIGLPLSLILLCLWLAFIFIGKAMAALILGDVIIKKLFKKEYSHLFWPLLIGVIILALLFSIPWFGWLVNLAAIWLGWGSIISYVTNKPKNI